MNTPERSLDPPDEPTPAKYCPGCGEDLYEGDWYYTDLDLCEFCIDQYKQRVSS